MVRADQRHTVCAYTAFYVVNEACTGDPWLLFGRNVCIFDHEHGGGYTVSVLLP